MEAAMADHIALASIWGGERGSQVVAKKWWCEVCLVWQQEFSTTPMPPLECEYKWCHQICRQWSGPEGVNFCEREVLQIKILIILILLRGESIFQSHLLLFPFMASSSSSFPSGRFRYSAQLLVNFAYFKLKIIVQFSTSRAHRPVMLQHSIYIRVPHQIQHFRSTGLFIFSSQRNTHAALNKRKISMWGTPEQQVLSKSRKGE